MSNYILPFSSTGATLTCAGGKGANLAELVRTGFAVPPGFIVTTDAYYAFVEANRLQPHILALAQAILPDDSAALENSSAEIRALFEQGTLPAEIATEIASAYHTLSNSRSLTLPAPPVAIRSSATAEDLPGLAFAGQQDTYLNVVGEGAVLDGVKRCWCSLWTARAIAYRARNHIPANEVALAVVIQKMIASDSSGVLFTANPVTGRRDEMVIDASFGLGEAIVSGQVDPDHYVVNSLEWKISERKLGAKEMAILPHAAGGTEQVRHRRSQEQALPDAQIIELAQIAQRVAEHFGSPQDIEWAWANRRLYLLQSRPITSLYPLPANVGPTEALRVYVNFNAIQGVSEPLTPLGIDTLRLLFSGVTRRLHTHSSLRQLLPDAGGRLFLDFTDLVRDPRLQKVGLSLLAGTEPGAQQTLLRLLEEGRIPPKRVLTARRTVTLFFTLLPVLRRLLAALLRPDQVRPRLIADAEQYIAEAQQHAGAASDLAACLRAMEHDLPRVERITFNVMPAVMPVVSAALPLVGRWLSDWLGEPPGAALQLMRGLPGNVTMEMDLKLWAVAQTIRADAVALEVMRTWPVEALVEAYRRGQLPANAQRTLGDFLQGYGMRGTAEIDLGRPRWRDDPTPIMQTLLNYLQLEDPLLAPDVLFQDRVAQAERLAREYVARARNMRFGWLRARLLGSLIRRMRLLGGLREAPLFYISRVYGIYRAALLACAHQLVVQSELERVEDIFFVSLETLNCFVRGEKADLKSIAAANRAGYERERARKQMPRVLLSTGEAFYEGVGVATVSENDLVGDAVSPGIVEGRVHVIFDPRGARLEPGDILVCPSTDPGWTPLFLTAGGLVMEIGGLMTHGSIVAREYGIPAVVGVHQATTRLQTGQRVRVDGNHGRVKLL
ncbi:MAG: phosphoenolpyruvate synthase [Chloroflexi bacterium]|nr:phosphoenolpyruvate synthase [Chloroflexota bacterium]MCI0575298.1 phosphoenolpyruvate synthase [Chloroflexota bacterium]MCI0645523.1 phosphoenolpyruvate synthase [Chloroflexota bacterium]MCI0726877.1 phosphoenolpyruvate synthase [Chloroflexota bacterium]